MPVMAAVTHSAEEDYLQEAEEQEQEEDREADAAGKESEVMAVIHRRVSVTVAKFVVIHHRRDGRALSIFSGLRYGSCNCRSLGNTLGDTGFVSHESAASNQAD